MILTEIYTAAKDCVAALPEFFEGVEVTFPFEGGITPIGDWSDRENMGMVVTGDGIGLKSGVYFFAKPDGEVIYIGKAQSLHQRVWGHVKTPETLEDGRKIFPKQGFQCENSREEIELIKSGKALLGVITISDSDLVSLIEVYLHTKYIKKCGKLPALNKQIG